jgi:hypothetical protein
MKIDTSEPVGLATHDGAKSNSRLRVDFCKTIRPRTVVQQGSPDITTKAGSGDLAASFLLTVHFI